MAAKVLISLFLATFITTGVGCASKCPDTLISDVVGYAVMRETNKTEAADKAKSCHALEQKYKDHDRCVQDNNAEFKLDALKAQCSALDIKAR